MFTLMTKLKKRGPQMLPLSEKLKRRGAEGAPSCSSAASLPKMSLVVSQLSAGLPN